MTCVRRALHKIARISCPAQLIPSWHNGRLFTDDIFKCIFINEKFGILIFNFTEVYSQGSNCQYVIIGSGNGLSLNRCWQTITWSNGDPVHWRIYATQGNMSFDFKYTRYRIQNTHPYTFVLGCAFYVKYHNIHSGKLSLIRSFGTFVVKDPFCSMSNWLRSNCRSIYVDRKL